MRHRTSAQPGCSLRSASRECPRDFLEPVEVRADAKPAPGAKCIDVGVAAVAFAAVGPRVAEARMDERDFAKDADARLDARQILAAAALCDEREKSLLVDDRAVDAAVHEVVGEVLIEPAHVA